MKSVAPTFPVAGMAFLRALKKNNDREWFTPRKEEFEEKVRQPMIALVEAVHKEMLKFAPAYVGEPAKTVFRIYRDTRFSKNKTPYKTHIGSYMWRNDLDKNTGGGFYFAVSPEETMIAAGLYHPMPDQLRLVRQHVAEHHVEFRRTFSGKKVRELFGELQGNPLSRPPKGFAAEHPAIDLIQCRRFVLNPALPPTMATSPDFVNEVVTRLKAATPFLEFLNRPLKRAAKTNPEDAW